MWAKGRKIVHFAFQGKSKAFPAASFSSSQRIATVVSFDRNQEYLWKCSWLAGAALFVVATSASSTAFAEAKGNAASNSHPLSMGKFSGDVEEESTKPPKLNGLKIFSGNANLDLATRVAELVGVELGKLTVERFADGEVNVMVHENVRGKDVYIIQPTCVPVNENLMELLLMVSTMRRASARRITAVIPYYGYARQDRKMAARVPISAADVARLLEAMGVDRVIAVDLHCGQIQGFFGPRVPVDNLDGGVVGVSYFGEKELVNPVIVSPDAGGVARAKNFREWLSRNYDVKDAGLAMIIKQRIKANEIDRMDLVGNVEGSDCIIVDDMIDTAGTLCKAAQHLADHGARNVYAFASHGLFNGPANERIANSMLKEVVVVNTTSLPENCKGNEKIKQLDIAPLVAKAIQNIHKKKSVSILFN